MPHDDGAGRHNLRVATTLMKMVLLQLARGVPDNRWTCLSSQLSTLKSHPDYRLLWSRCRVLTSLIPHCLRFCPFRFMHGDAKEKGDAPTGIDEAAPADQVQPRPQMFGFGKHLCPGRELSKLEILIFLRAFLTKFDYTLVEGQVRFDQRTSTLQERADDTLNYKKIVKPFNLEDECPLFLCSTPKCCQPQRLVQRVSHQRTTACTV